MTPRESLDLHRDMSQQLNHYAEKCVEIERKRWREAIYSEQAEIDKLRAKVKELTDNERAYTTIIGERSYQEVADALEQLTTDRDEWKQEALSAQERFKQAEARAAIDKATQGDVK